MADVLKPEDANIDANESDLTNEELDQAAGGLNPANETLFVSTGDKVTFASDEIDPRWDSPLF